MSKYTVHPSGIPGRAAKHVVENGNVCITWYAGIPRAHVFIADVRVGKKYAPGNLKDQRESLETLVDLLAEDPAIRQHWIDVKILKLEGAVEHARMEVAEAEGHIANLKRL